MPKPPPGPTQVQIGSDEEFEQVAGSSAESGFLCVVEVYASWCGATDAAVSTISRLNADFSGRKLRFYQVNADRVAALERFRAKSKPNFLLYKDGDHIDTIEGVNAPALNKSVGDHLPEGIVDVEVDEKGGEDDEDDE